MISFLIDENLSVSLVRLAEANHFRAHHITYLNRCGVSDPEVLKIATGFNAAIVTNNGKDFKKLIGDIDIHPGLIIIMPSVRTSEQEKLFKSVLNYLEKREDLINSVIEIDNHHKISEYELPK